NVEEPPRAAIRLAQPVFQLRKPAAEFGQERGQRRRFARHAGGAAGESLQRGRDLHIARHGDLLLNSRIVGGTLRLELPPVGRARPGTPPGAAASAAAPALWWTPVSHPASSSRCR